MDGYFQPHPRVGDIVVTTMRHATEAVSTFAEVWGDDDSPSLFHARCRHVGYRGDPRVEEIMKETNEQTPDEPSGAVPH